LDFFGRNAVADGGLTLGSVRRWAALWGGLGAPPKDFRTHFGGVPVFLPVSVGFQRGSDGNSGALSFGFDVLTVKL
jgi:hypothetical protein